MTVQFNFDIGSGGANLLAEIAICAADIVSGGCVAAYIVQFTDHFITHSSWNQPLTAPTMVWPDRSQDPNNAFYDITFALTVTNAYARARPTLYVRN
jgi:hypothetical protein